MSLQNGCQVSFKAVTSTILQSQSLELVTVVIVIRHSGLQFSGDDLNDWLMQLSDYNPITANWSDYTVRLQFCRLIRAK